MSCYDLVSDFEEESEEVDKFLSLEDGRLLVLYIIEECLKKLDIK